MPADFTLELTHEAAVALYETLEEALLALEHAYPHSIRVHYGLTAAPPPPQRDLFRDDALDLDPF